LGHDERKGNASVIGKLRFIGARNDDLWEIYPKLFFGALQLWNKGDAKEGKKRGGRIAFLNMDNSSKRNFPSAFGIIQQKTYQNQDPLSRKWLSKHGLGNPLGCNGVLAFPGLYRE
jgi:hypothetical protein